MMEIFSIALLTLIAAAIGTIPRLIDMGVEPYLIPPVLIASVAQRLVRTLCPDSGIPAKLSPSERRRIEEQFKTLPEKFRFPIRDDVYEPQKSPTCPTGLRGRMAVFEVMEMSPEIEHLVLQNPVDSQLWAAARRGGMLTMREDAILKAFDKKIPFSEMDALATYMQDIEPDQSAVPPPPTPRVIVDESEEKKNV